MSSGWAENSSFEPHNRQTQYQTNMIKCSKKVSKLKHSQNKNGCGNNQNESFCILKFIS